MIKTWLNGKCGADDFFLLSVYSCFHVVKTFITCKISFSDEKHFFGKSLRLITSPYHDSVDVDLIDQLKLSLDNMSTHSSDCLINHHTELSRVVSRMLYSTTKS